MPWLPRTWPVATRRSGAGDGQFHLVAYVGRRIFNRGVSPADLARGGCPACWRPSIASTRSTRPGWPPTPWWIGTAIQRTIADGSYPGPPHPPATPTAGPIPAAEHPGAAGGDVATSPLTPRVGRPAPAPPHARDRELASWHKSVAIRPRVSLDAVSRFRRGPHRSSRSSAWSRDPDHETDDRTEFRRTRCSRRWIPREQLIMKLRFGLDGQPRHSLRQIGQVLAVSKERVRQIQDHAPAASFTTPPQAPRIDGRIVRPAVPLAGIWRAPAMGAARVGWRGMTGGRAPAIRLPGAGSLQVSSHREADPIMADLSIEVPRMSPADSTSTPRASTATFAARPPPGISGATNGIAAASSSISPKDRKKSPPAGRPRGMPRRGNRARIEPRINHE